MLYRVQPGDRLSEIAAAHRTTTTAIVDANSWREPKMLASGELVFASLGCGDCLCLPADGEGCGDPADASALEQTYPPTRMLASGEDGRPAVPGPHVQTLGSAANPLSPALITTGAYCGSAKNVQQALNDLGYGPLAVDGVFGNASFAAMDSFGSHYGLGKVTYASPAFCTALKAALAAAQPTPPPQPAGPTPAAACVASGGVWNGTACVANTPVGGTTPTGTTGTTAPPVAPPGDVGVTTSTTILAPGSAVRTALIAVAVVGAVGLAGGAVYILSRTATESSRVDALPAARLPRSPKAKKDKR